MSKKSTIIISIIIFFLSGLLTFYLVSKNKIGLLSNYKKPEISQNGVETINGGPKTQSCPLNGMLYSKGQRDKWEKRRPLGIAIENHTDARPQSGLQSADVVYEAVAEGGITRFLAVYLCEDAAIVGPVRSARIYFIRLLQGYGEFPLYAHVGGANTPGPADALGEIVDIDWNLYNDLNQFAVPFPVYYRDYERLPDRATEHTMYSGTDKLWSYAAKNRKLTNVNEDGQKWDENFTQWKFEKDAKTANRGDVNNISFGFWDQFSKDYSVVWKYNKETNTYKRENGGVPHIDKDTGKTLEFKNIVVAYADESSANDGYSGGHLLYDVVGSGDGYIFRNGIAQEITWEKKKEDDAMIFIGKDGKEIDFTAGKIFIEILPTGNDVKY
ncbi:MAG: DUF3048 domain-containing protein [bacterium]